MAATTTGFTVYDDETDIPPPSNPNDELFGLRAIFRDYDGEWWDDTDRGPLLAFGDFDSMWEALKNGVERTAVKDEIKRQQESGEWRLCDEDSAYAYKLRWGVTREEWFNFSGMEVFDDMAKDYVYRILDTPE